MKISKIVLLKNIPKLGNINNIIKVKTGYARNYLIPNGIASPITTKTYKKKNTVIYEKTGHFATILKKIKNMEIIIKAATTKNNKLFASITSEDIQKILLGKGVKINANNIIISNIIKKIGVHSVIIKLAENFSTNLNIVIISK